MAEEIMFAKRKINEALNALATEDVSLMTRLVNAFDHVLHIDDRDMPRHLLPDFVALKYMIVQNPTAKTQDRTLKNIALVDTTAASSKIVSLSAAL